MSNTGDIENELKTNAQKLVDTLASFGVQTRIIDISRGPAVTRYELQPQAGVKISRITNLADDIALNLAASGVRIEAPIPNKAAVGIEVPNRQSSSVNIRTIFESADFRKATSPLTIALGVDIAGNVVTTDLTRMPHLLIAGSTGSGKSVCVNAIITSFLYKSSPEDVKLILIDPKVVELTEYNGAEMHPLMVEPYIALRDTVLAETGVRIYVADDYRTAEEQMEILESSEEGTAAAPGCSEHEAGLSLDVYAPYCAGKEFLKSAAGRMVNRVCGEYGFVIRYPLGKEEITGISYEPWHLRYVGEPHAEIMMNSGLTLEEYIQALTPEVWFAHGNYLILRTAADACRLPQGWERCEISEDNAGYRIVTLKMP